MSKPRTYATGFVDGWLSVLNEPVPSISLPHIQQDEDEHLSGFRAGQVEALDWQGRQAQQQAKGFVQGRVPDTLRNLLQVPGWQDAERDEARRRLASEELKRHLEGRGDGSTDE